MPRYAPSAPGMRRTIATLLLCLSAAAPALAQDVENLYATTRDRLADRPLVLHGGITLGAAYNQFSGDRPRFDRYDFTAGANLNADLLGFNIPVSLYFSDRNVLYRLPSYRFAGLSPSYKWARVHLGDRNLDFSRYTFSDQTFRGVGVELTPGKWTVKAMGGRLRYQSLFDVGARSGIEESYRRTGYAAEVGYRAGGWGVNAIAFAAEDELPDATVGPAGATLAAAPARNFVGSLGAFARVFGKVRLEGEYVRSYLTADLTAPAVPDSLTAASRPLPDRLSTTAADVIRVGLRHPVWRVGYERVAPGYRSLGTLWLQDDRDDLTAGLTFGLGTAPGQGGGKRWTISVDGGVERNGISERSRDRGRRAVGRVLANGTLAERLRLQGSYSNFNSTSRLRGFLDPGTSTDSVFIAQVNQQAQLGATYQPQAEIQSALTAQLSLTDVSTLRDGRLDGFGSTVTSAFLGYDRAFEASGFRFGVRGLYARTAAGPASQTTYGPSVTAQQTLLDGRLALAATSALTFVDFPESGRRSRVLNVRPTATYALERFGRLTLTYTHNARSLDDAGPDARGRFRENLLSLQYGWTF